MRITGAGVDGAPVPVVVPVPVAPLPALGGVTVVVPVVVPVVCVVVVVLFWLGVGSVLPHDSSKDAIPQSSNVIFLFMAILN